MITVIITVREIYITFTKILIPEVHTNVHLSTVPVYLNGILVDYSRLLQPNPIF